MLRDAHRPASRWRRYAADLAFLAIVLVGRGSLADHSYVPSGSMEPTLQVEDRLLVDKRAYGVRVPLTHLWLTQTEPRRGDVVVFDSPVTGVVTVKRLVGLPGDRIAFASGHLVLDGEPIPHVTTKADALLEQLPGALHPLHPGPDQGPSMREQVVPPDHFVVLGDHRGNSADSRSWGLVPRQLLLGRAVAILHTGREGLSFADRWWIPLLPREGEPPDPRLSRQETRPLPP